MKKITSALLLLTFLLVACSPSLPPAESDSTSMPESTATEAPAATEAAATETAIPVREAVISEIENTVSVRSAADQEFAPATINMEITAGGGLQTEDESRARIDLLPDGTILRVGPNSSFTLPEITEVDGQPKTIVELFFGKVYILLNGGSLDVKTPSGIASVRGSVLSVEYDPETKRVVASCLEGHCTLEDEDGTQVELIEGETSYIDFGDDPSPAEQIDSAEVQDWLDQIPEMPDFFEQLPNPQDFPEPSLDDFPSGDDLPGDGPPGGDAPDNDRPDDLPGGDEPPPLPGG